jgi:phenylpropionate dioxygenase-like ring-hydroxylating dioxygenase large terminal subunit
VSLRDSWYIAAQSRELRDQPLARTLFDTPLVIFRDASGPAQALLDRCAHRNMALSEGKVNAGCVECPYHGWRYDGAGHCQHVPSLGDNAKPPRVSVRSFPVIEQQGFIWVWMGDDPTTATSSRPYDFAHLGDPGWTTFVMNTRFEAGVEACLENFLDCPHTVYVHKGWFRSPDTRVLRAHVTRDATGACAQFEGEPISTSVVSKLLFPKGKEVVHTDRFILPNISRVDYAFTPERHFIITSQCTPISEHESQVYTIMTYAFGRIGWLVRLFFEPLSRIIIGQDVDVLKRMTRQLRRFGGAQFSHVETDLLGLHIQGMRRKMERGEPQDPDAPGRTIEIRF